VRPFSISSTSLTAYCLASEVLRDIDQPEAFFRQLRPSLRLKPAGCGLILGGSTRTSKVVEFGDFRTARESFQSGGIGAGAAEQLLTPKVREALASERGTALLRSRLQTALVADLNRMLDDPTLWPEVERFLTGRKTFLHPRRIEP